MELDHELYLYVKKLGCFKKIQPEIELKIQKYIEDIPNIESKATLLCKIMPINNNWK
jgi:hypothetical protein